MGTGGQQEQRPEFNYGGTHPMAMQNQQLGGQGQQRQEGDISGGNTTEEDNRGLQNRLG